MAMEISPLMGRTSVTSRRHAALAIAGTCAVLAMAAIVFVAGGSRPTALVQQAQPMYVMAPQPVANAQPMVYMPVQPVQPVTQQGLAAAPVAGATQQPVVYYYVPATPQAAAPSIALGAQMLNATGNSTGSDSDEPEFVCTVANVKALSTAAQTKWDACKTNPNYEEPNKDAGSRRRLLEWVWEPAPGEARAAPNHKPSHGPGSYEMVLRRRQSSLRQMMLNASGGNETSGSDSDDDGPSMQECMEDALDGACEKLNGCDDKVCANYYNEPEIEALCGMCGMMYAGEYGCFATGGKVSVAGKGEVAVEAVEVEDEVLSGEGNSRVYFIHDHQKVSKTVTIAYEGDSMELTPVHFLPVYTEECGERYCASAKQVRAESVKAGDRIYVQSAMGFVAKEVVGVRMGSSKVRYMLTESGTVVVNGVVASVHSTAAGVLETLPFRLMDWAVKGSLQATPVAAALRNILESPLLQSVEAAVNALAPSPKALAPARALGVTPLSA